LSDIPKTPKLKKSPQSKRLRLIIIAAAIVLIAVILLLTAPSAALLKENISGDFIAQAQESKKGYAVYEYKLGIINMVRGKNLSTAEGETFLGILSQTIPMHGAVSSVVADVVTYLPALFTGVYYTLLLTLLSTSCGVVGGIFFALGKISKFKPLSWLCNAYIFFFRGTPLLMQLFFIYYGLPLISPALAINDKFIAAFLALMLNSFAYCAEIVRAAIQSIDKGQMEAAKALGFSYGKTMRLIIIPQSVRRALPPVANEYIMVIKDCAIVSMIALPDLMKATSNIMNSTASVLVFLPSALLYLMMTAIFTNIFTRLEKRFSIYE